MTTIAQLCRTTEADLAALGDLGRPLVAVNRIIEHLGADKPLDTLADPTFALDIATAAGTAELAVVGRVLDFLRRRAGDHAGPVAGPTTTLSEAVARYDKGALTLMAAGTQHTYRTWLRRLVADLGDRDPATVTAADLTDLIARHARPHADVVRRRRTGRSAEENAVTAYRHLWAYLCDAGYATRNVASSVRKPMRPEPNRRPIRPDEAALLRALARTGRDSLLDEVTLTLPERLGLRRIEMGRLRLCDIHLDDAMVSVWGKNDKHRDMPLPPGLADLLTRYLDDRRPAGIPARQWAAATDLLLRRRPSTAHPNGRPTGRRRIEDLYARLADQAPDLFADGSLSLHSYRHALASYVDAHYGRAVTRAILGHTSRQTPTDHYVYVDPDTKAAAITAYEQRVLAADPATPADADTAA